MCERENLPDFAAILKAFRRDAPNIPQTDRTPWIYEKEYGFPELLKVTDTREVRNFYPEADKTSK